MKKIFLMFVAVMASLGANAQGVEVYQNGKLVDRYKNTQSDTYTYVLTNHPMQVDNRLSKAKFSVSETDQVQFTKGNLYWDGSDFHIELSQRSYEESYNANHVSHFFWTSAADFNSGDASYMPYAATYGYSAQSNDDKFFCGKENPMTVDNIDGLYALTQAEWQYLIEGRKNAAKLCLPKVTLNNRYIGMVIAPDDYTETLQDTYSASEWAAAENKGLVFLPFAGFYMNSEVSFANNLAYYWSATPKEDTEAYTLSSMFEVQTNIAGTRDCGFAIRLVKNIVNVSVESLKLNSSSMGIICGISKNLEATISPNNATCKRVIWTSSDESVATVENGVVTGKKAGTATITCTSVETEKCYATCEVTVIDAIGTAKATINGEEKDVTWVQLWKDGPKWAVFDVGATATGEFGNYYSWGAMEPQTTSNYKNHPTYKEQTNIQGTDYDTATKNWGNNWVMPTGDDLYWLTQNCWWSYEKGGQISSYNSKGTEGIVFYGKDDFWGTYVFFPFAGSLYQGEKSGLFSGNFWWAGTSSFSGENANALRLAADELVGTPDYGYSQEGGACVRPILK